MKVIFILLLLAGGSAFAQEHPQQLILRHELPSGDQNAVAGIVASNAVRPGTTVRYTAGQSIRLQPGFSAQTGSAFTASVASVGSSKQPTDGPNLSAWAYPNPFVEHTTVEYVLPLKGRVSYKLTNARGQVLRQSEEVQDRAAGRHQTRLEAGALPAGVYFYQVKSGAQTRILKLIRKE